MFSKSLFTLTQAVWLRSIHLKKCLLFFVLRIDSCANTPSCTHGRISFCYRFVANKNTKPRRRTCFHGYPDAIVSLQRRNRATSKHFPGFNCDWMTCESHFSLFTCLFYLWRLTAAAIRSASLNGRFPFHFLSVSKLCNIRWSERIHSPLSPNSDIKVGLRAICVNILLQPNSDLSRV